MKNILVFGFMLSFFSHSVYADSITQALADKVEEIVATSTREHHSGSEVVEKIASIFEGCTSSQTLSTSTKQLCTSYMNNYFPLLKKRRNDVMPGGVSVKNLGKLTTKERHSRLNHMQNSKSAIYQKLEKKYEYSVVGYPEHNFVFMVPSISSKNTPNSKKSPSCKKHDELMRNMIKKNISHYTDSQLKNKLAELKSIKCYRELLFQIYNKNAKYTKSQSEISFRSTVDELGNRQMLDVRKHQIPSGKSVEEAIAMPIQDSSGGSYVRVVGPAYVYVDKSGGLHYPSKEEFMLDSDDFTVSPIRDNNTSGMTKKTFGFGKDIQSMIKSGNAKAWFSGRRKINGTILLWLKNRPKEYYEIRLMNRDMSFLFGGAIAIDVFSESGKSSF